MRIATLFALFFTGSLFGSFFYTLALRYSDGRIRKDPLRALISRSSCPACHASLGVIDLVPVIGFLVRRGRCAHCGERISWLYPTAEIFCGLLIIPVSMKFPVTSGGAVSPLLLIHSASMYLILCLGVAISVIDVKSMTIPPPLTIATGILSVYPALREGMVKENLYGFLLMLVFFAVILLIFPGSFGGGDLQYASVLGFLFGLELSVVLLEVSLISGALSGIIYAISTRKGFRARIPFAPFLVFGMIVTLFYGREILLVYYGIIL